MKPGLASDLGPKARSSLSVYAFALLIPVLATLLRSSLTPLIGSATVPFITYFPAVLVVAWFGGLRAGLVSVLASALLADYYFVHPVRTLLVSAPVDRVTLTVFLIVGSGIALLSDAQRRVWQARDSLRTMLASIGDAVVATDLKGRIVLANRVAQDLMGWSEPEMLGQNLEHVFRIVNEGTRAPLESPFTRLLRERTIVGLANHTILIRRDGTEVPIDDSGAPIRNADGAITGTVLVFRDITERRRIERELAQSAERLQLALEAGNMGVWNWTPESGRVTWSPKLAAIHGLAPGTFGGTFDDYLRDIHPDDLATVQNSIQRSLEARLSHDIEYRIIWPDGSIRWVQGKGQVVIDSNGKVRGMTGLCMDITERKGVEQERRQLLAREQAARAEAERASRVKDDFLATASHELRTPLTAMLGWTRMLRGGRLDETTREQALKIIERNARVQAKLIEDILDVSRIVSGKLRLNVIPVGLAAIVEQAIETIRPAAEAKHIQIQKVTDSEVGRVLGDHDRLHQVVMNLLSNAVKFTPEAGTVELALRRLDSEIEIKVSDTGQGISPDFLPYVFEPFRQEDASPARVHAGLGLGLAIVRHLVKLHDGTVHAESAGLGKGAVFTVRLPSLPAPGAVASATEKNSLSADALHGIQVLVVEDDPDTREFLRVLLGSYGAQVRAAGSAREAREVLQIDRPDVLVCDIGLPEEDGYALIRHVRALESTSGGEIPAIALTAYARSEDQQQALAAGYQSHLPKPVDPVRLTHSIRMLVGRSDRAADSISLSANKD